MSSVPANNGSATNESATDEPAVNAHAALRPSGIVPKGEGLERERAARAGERPAVNAADIDYVVLNPRGEAHSMLATMYLTWREGWGAVLRDLAVTQPVRSNDFTRQDRIAALFIGGACAAVTALRFCDMSQPMWLDDSYFEGWPEDALARLGQRRICISSNTLIAPEWRGALVLPQPSSAVERSSEHDPRGAALPFKSVLFGMVVREFVASSADAMIGVSRNNRAMDRVARDHGAQRIGALQVHGIESDICLFERADIPRPHPSIEELWSRRANGRWFPALQAV